MTDIYCANLKCIHNDGILFSRDGKLLGWCRCSEIETDDEGNCLENQNKKGR